MGCEESVELKSVYVHGHGYVPAYPRNLEEFRIHYGKFVYYDNNVNFGMKWRKYVQLLDFCIHKDIVHHMHKFMHIGPGVQFKYHFPSLIVMQYQTLDDLDELFSNYGYKKGSKEALKIYNIFQKESRSVSGFDKDSKAESNKAELSEDSESEEETSEAETSEAETSEAEITEEKLNSPTELDCNICYEKNKRKECIVDCGHSFCVICIQKIKQSINICPTCRGNITKTIVLY
jgi:hypothetical protein